MKKLILLLLLVPMVSFGQTSTSGLESDFRNGYITGFKKGYCIDDSYCNPPFIIEVPLWGKMGFNTYSDGYSKGIIAGKAKKESANKESFSSQGAYENAGSVITSSGGAYENPTPVIQPIPGVAVGNAMTKAGEQIAGAAFAAMANVKKRNDVIVPLRVELNAFKYIVINSIDPNGGKAAGRGIMKKNLLKQGYAVIDLSQKKESKNDAIPKDLKSDPSIALYAIIWARDNMQGVQADLKLFDHKDNLVHQKTAVNFL